MNAENQIVDLPGHINAQQPWRRFVKNRPAVLSAFFLTALLLAIFAWPVLLKIISGNFAQTHNPNELSDAQFSPPNAQHWFGTDVHGRDVFSRVLFGAQVSLLVGFVGTFVSLIIGVLWGAVAGYAGGRLDNFLMRIVDVLYSLPSIIFVIVLITTLGEFVKHFPAVKNSAALASHVRVILLFVGLGAISWLTMARIVRGQVLSLRTRPFVEASRVLGQNLPGFLCAMSFQIFLASSSLISRSQCPPSFCMNLF